MENWIDSGNVQRAEPEYLRKSVIRSVEAVRLCDEFVQVEAFPLLSSVALQKVCQMINNNVELLLPIIDDQIKKSWSHDRRRMVWTLRHGLAATILQNTRRYLQLVSKPAVGENRLTLVGYGKFKRHARNNQCAPHHHRGTSL